MSSWLSVDRPPRETRYVQYLLMVLEYWKLASRDVRSTRARMPCCKPAQPVTKKTSAE